jgi:hypothetical protein
MKGSGNIYKDMNMLENFDSPDIYLLAGLYFLSINCIFIGMFCCTFALFDARSIIK